MSKIKVLIVDDSAFSRQTIKKILEADKGIEIAGISSDGLDAMAKTIQIRPDIITLDLDMPKMDGFSYLRWLMKNNPTPVIIVSSFSDSKTVFKALELGAADFIAKPTKVASANFQNLQQDLIRKVKGIKNFRMDRLSKNLNLFEEKTLETAFAEKQSNEIKAVAIGASTGGPAALKIIISRLPLDFPAAIAVSQHMPKGFTASFADRLNGISKLNVREAKDGEEITNGKVLICPGGFHMMFRKKGNKIVTALKEPKATDKYIPSVDLMMSSLADIFGNKTMGIVLTGMGSDGKVGMMEIKKKGGYTIVESEDTAVVFGMPNEVIKSGAATRVLPLQEIPEELIKLVTKN